ncbi:MAG: hypothetical protein WBD99_10275 [Thermodesulfobacteriota bacterium]
MTGGNSGGIRNAPFSTLIVIASTVNTNTSDVGGGISNRPNGMLTVTGSLVSNNAATSDGGGIATLNASLVLFNTPNNCVGFAAPGCL